MNQVPTNVTMAFGENVPLEHQIVLRSTAVGLQKEFNGVFGQQTIERFLLTSYDDFGRRVTNERYLPVFAERFARERLLALAKVEGKSSDDRPVVLFLCTHNAGRSQMALGFFRALAGDRAVAWSGGSEPGSEVNPVAIKAMAEVGIDISGEFPKPWTDEVVRAADVVVTMGCGDACPVFPGKRYVDWTLADPHQQGIDEVRIIRDEVRGRVIGLLAELGVPVQ
jgi:arsenate reductase